MSNLKCVCLFILKSVGFTVIFWSLWLYVLRPISTPTQNNSASSDTQAKTQMDTYEQQAKRAAEQLDASDAQLKQSNEQLRKMDEIISAQAEQARRYDLVLEKWEKQAGIRK